MAAPFGSSARQSLVCFPPLAFAIGPHGTRQQAGPFGRIRPSLPSLARVNQAATLTSSLKTPVCQGAKDRGLEIARACSNIFGAALVSVAEAN